LTQPLLANFDLEYTACPQPRLRTVARTRTDTPSS
jgi:hypothetical protein